MQFDILTLFPGMFAGPLTESIIKRAVQAGLISIGIHDIRAYTTDKHHTADDAPYGGGAGMVMKAEPLAAAIRDVLRDRETGRQGDKETGRQGDTGSDDHRINSFSPSPPLPLSPSRRTLVILMTPAGELF